MTAKIIESVESKSFDDRLRYLGLWMDSEERRSRHNSNYSKFLKDYLVSELMTCLWWLKTWKVPGVTVWNLAKFGAPGILPGIFSTRVVTGEQMEPAGSVDNRCT